MVAPSYLPEWALEDTTLPATGNSNKSRPKESLRNIGWDKGQIPSAEEFNWLFNNMYLWLTYFSEEIKTFLPLTGTSLTFTGSITGKATWNGDKAISVNLVSDLDKATSADIPLTLVKRGSNGEIGVKNVVSDGTGSFAGSVGAHGLSSDNGLTVSSGTTSLQSTKITSVDIDGGTIDGTAIGSSSTSTGKFTDLSASGTTTLSTVDINGGTIDGTTIGASTAAPATVSTFTANNAVTLIGGVTSTGTNTFSGSNTFSSKLNLQSSNVASNGYTYLPNGVIMQWGWVASSDDSYIAVTLPLRFPNACFNVQATANYNTAITNDGTLSAHAYIDSTSTIHVAVSSPTSDVPNILGVYWTAIGY